MKNLNESKHGFWGALARKSKAILDDDNEPQRFDSPGNGRTNVQMPTTATRSKVRFYFDIFFLSIIVLND